MRVQPSAWASRCSASTRASSMPIDAKRSVVQVSSSRRVQLVCRGSDTGRFYLSASTNERLAKRKSAHGHPPSPLPLLPSGPGGVGGRSVTRGMRGSWSLDPVGSRRQLERRGRDSNPRWVAPHMISNHAPSTTRTPLQVMISVRSHDVVVVGGELGLSVSAVPGDRLGLGQRNSWNGEGGIRTHGDFRHTRFRVWHHRPLGHLPGGAEHSKFSQRAKARERVLKR